MQHIRVSRVGKAACAVILSCLLAISPLVDGASFYAFADEEILDPETTQHAPTDIAGSEEEPQKREQVNEDKPLVSDPVQIEPSTNGTPSVDDAGASDKAESKDADLDVNVDATDTNAAGAYPDASADSSIDDKTSVAPQEDRVTADVPLSQDDKVAATVGTVVVDRIKYTINPDGGTASVTGWHGNDVLKGDVIIAAKVSSGSDEYRVTSIADEAFKDCIEMESAVLPDSLESIGEDAFKGCSELLRFEAGELNQKFAVHDGMLFDKELVTLLLCPQGKQPMASLPASATAIDEKAFAGCRNLEAIHVDEGNQAFASVDGVLYSADLARLLLAPAKTVSAIVAPETKVIVSGAFAECFGLSSIIANGYVETIEGGAFSLEALTEAMVALASGDDYDARKAVWDKAGFSHYIEPAAPGEIQQPEPAQSGFVYELLDDYTLAVSWSGESDPEANLVIPTTAKLNDVEYRVSTIAPYGFQGRASLSSVQIRAPITVVGDHAFAGCSGLASVELTEGVASIGAGAFSGTAVERVVIPSSVTSVGAAAFADCSNLSQVLTLSNNVTVAGDAIAGCTGVAIYAPYDEAGEYPWNPGIVASGNHNLPYGISFAGEPLAIEVGETADLFEGGVREVPESCDLAYAYAATPISVEAGQVTGKKIGTSEVTAVLTLGGVELDRAVRAVEVVAGRPTPYASGGPYYDTVTFAFNTLGGAPVPPDQTEYREGGWATSGSITRYDVSPNAVKPDNPSKQGYNFKGWYLPSNPNSLFNFANEDAVYTNSDREKLPDNSSKVTLYAKWERAIPEGAVGGIIGTDAETVTWYITSGNELVIAPANGESGTLPDYVDDSSFPWVKNTSIKTATIEPGVKTGSNVSHLFDGCSELVSINGLNNLDTQNATNMGYMFSGCFKLSDVDLSNFVTSNVTNMDNTFNGCASIVELDVSKLNTANVASMGGMFLGCSNLTALEGLDNFDTLNVVNMRSMFEGCSELAEINVSSFKTSNVSSMFRMFYGCSKLVSLDLSTFNTGLVRSMEGMFSGCSELKNLNVSALNTSSVTSMVSMFSGCANLQSLDVSNWNTSKVASMASMFSNCKNLQLVGISKFDVSNVKGMGSLFRGCEAITELDLSSWETPNVLDMYGMFLDCSNLRSLNLAKFDTRNVASMYAMFGGCANLESLDLSMFETGNVADMGGMFGGCTNLATLNLSSFDTRNVTNMAGMFRECAGLKTLDISSFRTPLVSNMSNMFNGCTILEFADVSKFETLNVGSMAGMFGGCANLQNLDVSNWNTSNVTNMGGLFSGCASLLVIDVSRFDTSKATTMGSMFRGCEKVSVLDVSNWNTSNVSNMYGMFLNCNSVQALNVSNFKTSNVVDMYCMFAGCANVESLDVSTFKTEKVTDVGSMFAGCEKITSLTLSSFDTTNVTNMAGMFKGCANLSAIDGLSSFKTSNVSAMNSMFNGCQSLTSIDVSKFVTSNVTNMGNMFNGCSGISELDVSGFNTLNVAMMGGMFQDCDNLATLNVSSFNTENVTAMDSMFAGCTSLETIDGLGSFNTSKVTTMNSMFRDCSSLSSLDVSKFTAASALSLDGMFSGCSNLSELDVSMFAAASATSMFEMFKGCSGLVAIEGLSALDASQVTNMGYMFAGCSRLTSLDVSGINTANATNMAHMFNGCSSLESIDVSNFNTVHVEGMNGMFYGCSELSVINGLEKFNTSNTTNMGNMFNGCSKIGELDVSSFRTPKVENMGGMFQNCRTLSSLSLSVFDTSNVVTMNSMFSGCASLADIDTLRNFKTQNVTNMDNLFNGCSSLASLDLSSFDTSNVASMGDAFLGCTRLSALDISSWDTAKVTTTGDIFGGCSSLVEVAVGSGYSLEVLPQLTMDGYTGNWLNSTGTSFAYDAIPSGVSDTYKAELATYAISYELNGGSLQSDAPLSYTLKSADVVLPTPFFEGAGFMGWFDNEGLTGDPVTAIAAGSTGDKTFYAKWKRLIPSGAEGGTTGGVTWYITADGHLVLTPTNGIEGTMDEITATQLAPWSDWKPLVRSLTVETGVIAGKSLSGAFSDCINLTSVDLSGLNTTNTQTMSFLFSSCLKLPSIDLSVLDTSSAVDMFALLSHCESLTTANLSNLDTSNVVYMLRMFNECHSLQTVDLTGFNTSKVRDMDHMFYNCMSLESLDVSNWTITNADTDLTFMFENCSALSALDVSSWSVSGAIDMSGIFKGCASLATLDLSGWDTSKATNMTSAFEGCSTLANITLPNGFANESVKDASKLFFDCPNLTTIPANLSLHGSVPANQAFGFSEAPAEFVATTYAGEDARLLDYDWISDCRLLNDTVQVSGDLPTDNDTNDGRWELSANGTLRIWCERFGAVIQDFGWETSSSTIDCWSPLRANVKKVIMDESVDAVNMAYWFSDMASLADIEGVYIPSSVTSARGLFQGSGISKVPDGFELPEGMSNANRMFRNCKNLISMPRAFKLSSTVADAANMFDGCSSLRNLPDEFTMPERMTSCSAMFLGCSSLESLPSGFSLPRTIEDEADFNNMFSGCSSLKALPEGLMQNCDETVTNLNGMFLGCSSLASLPKGFMLPSSTSLMHGLFANCGSLVALPDGFALPTGVTSLGKMFNGCTSLRYVPASFNFNTLPADMRTQDALRSAFGHDGDTIETYYRGTDLSDLAPEGADAAQYWLSAYKRVLVSDIPGGSHLVSFKIPDGNGAYGEPFATALSNAEDKIAYIEAPTREGVVFVGWYIDEACTQPFDFAKTVAEQALSNGVLFGRYEKTSTTLPTVEGGEHASWELTQDGTLHISCEDGYTIADFGWEAKNNLTDHWSSVRSKVERIQMGSNVKAESMACWFMGMDNLVDASGAFIPDGVTNVEALFKKCVSLTALPEGFIIPEGVWYLDGMMNSTPKLTGLPDGFRLPESAEIVAGMFEGSGIQSLPAGFTITKNVTDTRWMFQSCAQLTELPEGFKLPLDGRLDKAKNMFNMATGLKSIPVGYTIPASVSDCSYMFGSCRSLTTIPEGFSLPSKGDLMAEYMFQSCNSLSVIPASLSLKGLMNAGWDPETQGKEMFMVYSNQSPVISTLYMGKASDVPGTEWWRKQRRTLYFANDPDNPLPSGVKQVTFKIASVTVPGEWDDYVTMITDEDGKLTQPGDPKTFGYPFKGWYTSETCVTKFNFDTQITSDDVVVYGAFGAPILRGTVPLAANVVVDTSGNTTTASAEIRSFTPVEIDLTSIACETGPGIAEVFPNEADRTKPFATVQFQGQEPIKAPFDGEPATTSVAIPLSAGFADPGSVNCNIGLDLNGAKVQHRIEDHTANVANIVWTVELKK